MVYLKYGKAALVFCLDMQIPLSDSELWRKVPQSCRLEKS